MQNIDSCIMAVTATPNENGKIRLKYLAIAGGCGPEIALDRWLALQTIEALQSALNGKAFDSNYDYKRESDSNE